MNQTRVFLIFAWLMVATLLWMEWGKESAAPASPAASTTAVAPSTGSVPAVGPVGIGNVPGVPTQNTAPAPVPSSAGTAPGRSSAAVTVTTDVLRVVLDGGEIRQADLLDYPSTAENDSPPVRLFAQE